MGLRVEKSCDSDSSSGYFVPARLVNMLVSSILAGLLSIAGYMIVWNRTDAQWKALHDAQMIAIASRLGKAESTIERGILPLAEQRLRETERRLSRLEEHD